MTSARSEREMVAPNSTHIARMLDFCLEESVLSKNAGEVSLLLASLACDLTLSELNVAWGVAATRDEG